MAVAGALVAVALLASGCSSDGGSDAGPSTTTERPTTTTADGGSTTTAPGGVTVPGEDATFVRGDCWWPTPADLPKTVAVTCGTVDVPADHGDPKSTRIQLAVARVHDSRADAKAPPVVFLHGGPGGDALSESPTAASLSMATVAERDLILFDQRGAGRTTPSLNCPEKEEATLVALTTTDDWADEFGANERAVRACRKRLVAAAIDLGDYDTPASVEDLESIRHAFGIDSWNLWGRSYGTRLGLAYAREHGDRVRSLLIDSVYAPEVGGVARNQGLPSAAIAALTKACDADAPCLAANGHVDDQLATAVAAFDAEPAALTATVPIEGKDRSWDFRLTGSDLAGGMFAAQYRSELVPQLPAIIAGLAGGDRRIVSAFVSTGVPSLIGMSEGAFYSFECADSGRAYGAKGFAAMREDPGVDALYALGTAEPFCQAWDVPEVGAGFDEPVTADVPTLVYGGTLDPITPYAESKAQAERMPDARLVTVPGAGHGDSGNDDCTVAARDGFWKDPAAALPACVAALTAPPFAT